MSTPRTDSTPRSTRTLSEPVSKALVARYGVRLPRELAGPDPDAAAKAAFEIGFPVVLKLAGDGIAHKTERKLVRVGLGDPETVVREARDLLSRARPEDGPVTLLVAEQVRGQRELIAGLVRDPQFGPCVMLGQGGVLAEALADAVFAVVPLAREEALRMIDGLATRRLFTEPHRGEPALDREALADVLEGLSRLALDRPEIESVDLNPLILHEGVPVAVDALVEVAAEPGRADRVLAPPLSDRQVRDRFQPLFHPRGIVVAGVASHPGKFGFVTFHNLLRCGYEGALFGVKPDAAPVLGQTTYPSVGRPAERAPRSRLRVHAEQAERAAAAGMCWRGVCARPSSRARVMRRRARRGLGSNRSSCGWRTSSGCSSSGRTGRG